ncbi:COX15/CtaA family protein [Microbacterium amylolyticum]|uniref:Cytochrome c oxidase assembly protein subunit 15 n=1 Tax=Microbacterium amylolyticum TaxID=936337 RepID=A0ABS4ZKN1_9MICO|nr:COX15/CtaA family protein [Microbacterium amylolyticum]MBP2437855.1 cytochrome c oxidase assembly protein subunit 15 [Microbacterium amylolyticum]
MTTTVAPSSPTVTGFSPALRIFAWLSFLAETLIIGTGGAVRLTGSGLGCTEWPLCTPDSLVPTEDMGIHGVIEFGNRTMTGVVGIVAIGVLLLTLAKLGGRQEVKLAIWFAVGGVAAAAAGFAITQIFVVASSILLLAVIIAAIVSVRRVPMRRDLSVLAWIVVAGVVAQAFAGGITVLTSLNAFMVGFHYAASLALVCVTVAFLVRLSAVPGPRRLAVPRWYAVLSHVTAAVLGVTIVFGILTTANGPHSGDLDIVRDGFDATFLAHVHAWPGYALAALALALMFTALAQELPTRNWSIAFVAVLIVQIIVGVWQANHALPPLLVGIHMVLAALTAAAYVVFLLRLKEPRDTAPPQ